MADPRIVEKRRLIALDKMMEQTAAVVARLEATEAKLDEAMDLLRRVTHAIETGGGPGTLDEETGPSVPRRRRPRPEPEGEAS
jgi:hypothetical protein